MENEIINPFVGAIPYDESHSKYFYGRTADIRRVYGDASIQRLSILAGGSACGKTSFLQAGLIPAVKQLRLQSGKNAQPPVILIRDWAKWRIGLKPFSSLDEFKNQFMGLLEIAVTDMDEISISGQSAEDLYNELKIKGVMQVLLGLSEAFNGLYVIFDQLEELFVSHTFATETVCDFLAELYYLDDRIKIIVSLRQEYVHELRTLEKTIGSIMQRTCFLPPLKREQNSTASIMVAIKGIFNSVNINIDDSVIYEVADRCRLYTKIEGDRRYGGEINLLQIQAFYWEFFNVLKSNPRDSNHNKAVFDQFLKDNAVTARVLEKYLECIRAMYDYTEPLEVYDKALVRWIDTNLSDNIGKMSEDIQKYIYDNNISGRLGGIRWCLTRLSSHLSSNDYKVPINRDEHKARLLKNALNSEEEKNLRELFDVAIDFLGKINVLKNSDGPISELVHDQLGQSIRIWSEMFENSWQDSIYSPITNRGVYLKPIRVTIDKISDNYNDRFVGCIINGEENSSHSDSATFKGIDFHKWDFTGSIFKNCIFDDCTFSQAQLQGLIFWNCIFRNNTSIKDITYESSQLDIRGGKIEDLSIIDSCLEQLNLYPNIDDDIPIIFTKNSSLVLRNTCVRLSCFKDLHGEAEAISLDEKSRFEFCLWDKVSANYIKASAHQMISCGLLKEE